MEFTQNEWSQHDIINNIMIYEPNKVQILHRLSFQKNVRNILQPQYLNMRMFWLK